jgi:hypothetical protein
VAIWAANKQPLDLFHDDGIYVDSRRLGRWAGAIISLPTTPPQTSIPFLYSYLLSRLRAVDSSFPGAGNSLFTDERFGGAGEWLARQMPVIAGNARYLGRIL